MHSYKVAGLHSRGLVNKTLNCRRNVKAAFESDNSSKARRDSKHDRDTDIPGQHADENELLPVHHPGSFPLHGPILCLGAQAVTARHQETTSSCLLLYCYMLKEPVLCGVYFVARRLVY